MTERWAPSKWFIAGLGVGPLVVALAVTGMLSRPGPASARASTPQVELPAPPGASPLREATVDERRALSHIYGINLSGIVSSPMLAIETPTEPREAVVPVVRDAPPPTVRLTSILGGSRPIAVLDGRPFSVGDTVRDPWVVLSIDPREGFVVLENSQTLATLELSLRAGG